MYACSSVCCSVYVLVSVSADLICSDLLFYCPKWPYHRCRCMVSTTMRSDLHSSWTPLPLNMLVVAQIKHFHPPTSLSVTHLHLSLVIPVILILSLHLHPLILFIWNLELLCLSQLLTYLRLYPTSPFRHPSPLLPSVSCTFALCSLFGPVSHFLPCPLVSSPVTQ